MPSFFPLYRFFIRTAHSRHRRSRRELRLRSFDTFMYTSHYIEPTKRVRTFMQGIDKRTVEHSPAAKFKSEDAADDDNNSEPKPPVVGRPLPRLLPQHRSSSAPCLLALSPAPDLPSAPPALSSAPSASAAPSEAARQHQGRPRKRPASPERRRPAKGGPSCLNPVVRLSRLNDASRRL